MAEEKLRQGQRQAARKTVQYIEDEAEKRTLATLMTAEVLPV